MVDMAAALFLKVFSLESNLMMRNIAAVTVTDLPVKW